MNSEELITDHMRQALLSQGSGKVVTLHMIDKFFNAEFVERCIEELERMPLRTVVGDEPTNLERLAFCLLCDSAYIDLEKRE